MVMHSGDVVAGNHGFASDYNNLRKDVKNGITNITSNSDGATVTFDLSQSKVHAVTLGGNRNLAVSNATVGQAFIVRLTQDGSGSRTVTWWSTIKWPGGSAPTLSTTINTTDVFGFLCTSSGNYDGYYIALGVA